MFLPTYFTIRVLFSKLRRSPAKLYKWGLHDSVLFSCKKHLLIVLFQSSTDNILAKLELSFHWCEQITPKYIFTLRQLRAAIVAYCNIICTNSCIYSSCSLQDLKHKFGQSFVTHLYIACRQSIHTLILWQFHGLSNSFTWSQLICATILP